MQSVRIIEFPACLMAASPVGTFGDAGFDSFAEWISSQPRGIYPSDFLTMEEGGMRWLYLLSEGMQVPHGYETVAHPGGLYAVTTDIDMQTDMAEMYAELDVFLKRYGLERDDGRPCMGNIISSPAAAAALGCEQMDYYTPVRKTDER